MSNQSIVDCIRDLNLHDSELLNVVVRLDEVTMHLNYIEDYDTMKTSRRCLVFQGCSRVLFVINPGYAPPDSILLGDESESAEGRKCRIEMNTTASVIEITAKNVVLL